MSELNRLHWRCRRGMLELDLLLEKFMEQHYAMLQPEERACFHELLEYQDQELWDLLRKSSSGGDHQPSVLALLRGYGSGTATE